MSPRDTRPLYVSACEVLLEVAPEYVPHGPETMVLFDSRHPPSPTKRLALPKTAVALLRKLQHGEDVIFTLFSDFWSYDAIAHEVAASRALLAIVDEYYMSSTGKMIEAGYARATMPILAFPVNADAAARFARILGEAGVTILSEDPAEADRQVRRVYHEAGGLTRRCT